MPIDQARLHRALNPSSVAVVGDKGPQYQWLSNQEHFTGQLYSVQLDEKEIPGIEAKGITNYKSLKDIPGDVDLVICAVPRQVTPFVVADAIEKGVGGISMFTSGFAETKEPQGIELQAKLVQMCTDAGMPLVGPNCMGVYNRKLGVKFGGGLEHGEGGDVSVISQSGTHGIGMTNGAQSVGVKVRRTISFGNAVILNESDYLEYLVNDPETPAIAMYLEGTRDGRRFFNTLREATKKKPVIVWKGGRSTAGSRAVNSHTGSLASSQSVWDAMLKQTGAIAVGSIEEAIDAIAALVHTEQPTGRDIALIAMTGGQSVAITDQFERFGFNVPELSQRSYDRFAEFFMTVGGSYRNPFDAASTIRSEAENLQKILEILADEPIITGGVALEFRSRGFEKPGDLEEILDLLDAYRAKTKQPVILVMPTHGVMTGDVAEVASVRDRVAERGFAVYPSFERGAQGLGRVVDHYTRE
ncbi:MAG: CoA-binding protein [Chloroflexi bacterium]|nr:CoA-binding protein [Chloroflexota bacterium]MDA1147051.1 CoA-binding protein [Chloroflexota bacterium]